MKNNMERLVKELQERFGEEYEVVSSKMCQKTRRCWMDFKFPGEHWYGIIFYPGF